jgi:hypothetical protein
VIFPGNYLFYNSYRLKKLKNPEEVPGCKKGSEPL